MMYARDELKIDNFIITDEKDEDKIMSQSGINAWIGKSEIRRQFYENYKGEPAEFMNYILKYCYEYAESVQYNISKMTAKAGFSEFDIVDSDGKGMEEKGLIDYSQAKFYTKSIKG